MPTIQSPATYNFAGNISPIIVSTNNGVDFSLYCDGIEVLKESHNAFGSRVTVELKSYFESLSRELNFAALNTVASEALKSYTYKINGVMSTPFYVILGGVGTDNLDAALFCKTRWLTWQPQTRYTAYHTPQYLSYASLQPCKAYVKAYFTDSTTETVLLCDMAANTLYDINVTYGRIRGLFVKQPLYYDIWVESLSYVQRYVLAQSDNINDDVFIFQNSLGGHDSIKFSGETKEIASSESSTAVIDGVTGEYANAYSKSWLKYTGYIPDEAHRLWILDFFSSRVRYEDTINGLHRIYVSKPKLESVRGELSGYEFTYALSKSARYLNLDRGVLPTNIEIIDPAVELFFLAPKLNQFPIIDGTDYIIPVQYPYNEKWHTISCEALTAYLQTVIKGGGDVPELPAGEEDDVLYHNGRYWIAKSIQDLEVKIADSKLDAKLDKAVWDAEFEVTEEALVHKRTALFKSLVVFDEFEAGGGGGGADLPVGVLGDVLYHDGASWVAKQASTLGFVTQTWVEAKGYATQTWVNSNDFVTKLWVAEQSFATTVQLDTKLDKTIWEREFTPTDDAVEVNRNMAFRKQLIFEEYADVPVGGTSNYPDLTNLPTIGGVTVLGGRTLTDYGLGTYDFATQSWANGQFALKTQIPSLMGYATQTWVAQQGYATQTWVTNKGYLTGITKAQVLGVMSGSGSASQYLAGNGTFYTVGYGELSGKPDLSVYALKAKVITLDGNVSTNRANNMGNETWFDYSFGGSGIAGSAISFSPTGGGYATQISASYGGNELAFRTYNGDSRVWTAVRRVWHDGNAGTSANDWNSRNMNVHGTFVCYGQVVFATY